MKKSEMYKMAQLAVLRDNRFSDEDKLETVRLLQSDEASALYWEEREAAKNEEN